MREIFLGNVGTDKECVRVPSRGMKVEGRDTVGTLRFGSSRLHAICMG